MERVCVIGLGRVGLTLSVTLANVGIEVTGVEADRTKAAMLQEGKPHFYERGLEPLLRKVLGGRLAITHELSEDHYSTYIIAVATPVDQRTHRVNLEPLTRAIEEAARNFRQGNLVILRSTVPVGATRHIALPLLAAQCRPFHLAFCPERTVEGNALVELRQLPQIVGGLDEESTNRAAALFSQVTDTIVRAPSLEAAEMIKLIDNTFRDLNFAFANEIALVAEALGLDGYDLIRSANLGYPRNNIPVPGFVGGMCLSKDPHILIESAASAGYTVKLAAVARSINSSLPAYIGAKLKEWLASVGKAPEDSKIHITGLAFKGEPHTDDIRDSPGAALASYLTNSNGGKTIYGHDFIVPVSEIRKVNIEPCSLEDGFRGADAVVFANNHPAYHELDIYHLASLMNKPGVIADVWHMFDAGDMTDLPGVIYRGLGRA